MKNQYKKLRVDFPIEEYTYLKMACAKQGISIKEFVIKAIFQSVEEALINGGQIDFSMILVAKSRIHKLTYSLE